MSYIQTKKLNLAGEYNRLSDPGAGAIGNVLLGVYIPVKALITGFWVIPIVAFVGAGATLSFGTRNQAGVITVNNLKVATGIGAFVVRVPVAGVDLNAVPISFLNDTVQVTMTIAGAPITAGRVAFFIDGNTSQI